MKLLRNHLEACSLESGKFNLKLLILLLDLVVVRWLKCITLDKTLSKLVNGVQLLFSESRNPARVACVGVVAVHGLNFECVLQLGSLFLEFVVILLQDFNQLAEVFNLLSLQELDLLEVDTVVVRHSILLAQVAVFCCKVFNDVCKLIVLSHSDGVVF